MKKLYHRTMMVSLLGRVQPLEASCNGRFLSADLIIFMIMMMIMVIIILKAYIAKLM